MNYPTHTKVLALDLGTTTGFALLASGIVYSGSEDFTRYKGCKSKAADHIGQTILDFHKWLREEIQNNRPDCLAYESVYRWSSSDAAKTYGALRGILLLNAAAYRLPVFGYSPTHIKKYWTGKGNADKSAMVKVTKTRFPDLTTSDDNECDAIALLHLHLNQTLAPK